MPAIPKTGVGLLENHVRCMAARGKSDNRNKRMVKKIINKNNKRDRKEDF